MWKNQKICWHQDEIERIRAASALSGMTVPSFIREVVRGALSHGLPQAMWPPRIDYQVSFPGYQREESIESGVMWHEDDHNMLKKASKAKSMKMARFVRQAVLPVANKIISDSAVDQSSQDCKLTLDFSNNANRKPDLSDLPVSYLSDLIETAQNELIGKLRNVAVPRDPIVDVNQAADNSMKKRPRKKSTSATAKP